VSPHQTRVRSQSSLLVVAIVATLGTGCATKHSVARTKPAELNLKGVTKIAVLPFPGPDGAELTSLITQGLFDSKRFEVVEREQLNKIMREQGMSIDTAFQGGGVAVGKLLPATALVSGRVMKAEYKESTGRSNETCTREVDIGNKKTKTEKYACVSYTRQGGVQYLADVKVLDTTTGQILATRSLPASIKDSKSAIDQEPDRIDDHALMTACRTDVASRFVKMVAPHTVMEQVVLATDGDLPELAAGNEYFTRNDNQKAVEYFTKAVARADASSGMSPKTKGKAHYSLGLGQAVTGDYPNALAQLDQAYGLDPNTDYLDFATRVKQWKVEADKLAQQSEK